MRVAPILVASLVLALVPGCTLTGGEARQVGRAFVTVVEHDGPAASRMSQSHWLDGTIVALHPPTAIELQAAQPTERRLLSRVADVPTDDQREVVEDACLLLDAGKVESESDAMSFLASQGKGPGADRAKAFGLAQELKKAKTGFQRNAIIAQAVICEVASG